MRGDHGRIRDLLKYPHFLFAVFAQFMYVGAQVGTWSYFIQYVQETYSSGEKAAAYFLNRHAGGLRRRPIYRYRAHASHKAQPADGFVRVINVLLVAIGVLHPSWIGLWAIFLTSFFMSLMFPTIFALGIKGLGPNTKIGGSLIIMAIIGGAVLTPAMGLLSQAGHGVALAYLVPLVAYLCVGVYGFVGARWGLESDAA